MSSSATSATTPARAGGGLVRRAQRALFFLSLALLTGCEWRYGLSASASVPVPGTYCQPLGYGRMICREGDEVAWDCVDLRGYWSCRRIGRWP